MTRGHRGSLLLRCRTFPCPFSRPVYPGAPQPLFQHPDHRDLSPRPPTPPPSPRHPAHARHQPATRPAIPRRSLKAADDPAAHHQSVTRIKTHVRRTGLVLSAGWHGCRFFLVRPHRTRNGADKPVTALGHSFPLSAGGSPGTAPLPSSCTIGSRNHCPALAKGLQVKHSTRGSDRNT